MKKLEYIVPGMRVELMQTDAAVMLLTSDSGPQPAPPAHVIVDPAPPVPGGAL